MSIRETAPARPSSGRMLRSDRGQVAIELLGMAPTIIITLVLLWQCVLLGYTYTLAGNAADEAVRAGTAATGDRQDICEQAGRKNLPDTWQDGAEITCTAHRTGFVTADVDLKVPVLFPGTIDFPLTLHGHAGTVTEVTD